MDSQEYTLVSRAAQGDKEAFHEIYKTTYGKVARYVHGMVKNESLAEDVLVQTYTIAWQKASNYKGDSRLTTWLIGIARNVAFKEFRKTKHHVPFEETYIGEDNESSKKAETNNRNSIMKAALNSLSAKHREVLELAFFQGLTYPEIANMTTAPVSTIKTRVFHAKKALKKALLKKGITQDEI